MCDLMDTALAMTSEAVRADSPDGADGPAPWDEAPTQARSVLSERVRGNALAVLDKAEAHIEAAEDAAYAHDETGAGRHLDRLSECLTELKATLIDSQ